MNDILNNISINNSDFRKQLMESLNLKLKQEFYLKIAEKKTNHQYKKLPENGYLGIKNYDDDKCFLVKFKFIDSDYKFTSDCAYMSELNYQSAFNGIINSEYIPITKMNIKEKFYIQIIDNISIYEVIDEDDEDTVLKNNLNKNILDIEFNFINNNNSYKSDTLRIVNTGLSSEEKFRKNIMEALNLKEEENFYLKIYKEKSTLQYKKVPKEGYIGLKDYDMGVCFLIKFKFSYGNYKFTSDCKYLSSEKYEDILLGILSGEYNISKKIDFSKRVYIYIIDNISIYKLDYEEDKAIFEKELDKELEAELEFYNSLEDEDAIPDEEETDEELSEEEIKKEELG